MVVRASSTTRGVATLHSCSSQPSFGVEGNKTAEFCLQHAKEGIVNVKDRNCAQPTCNKRPSHGVKSSKAAEFSAGHAKEGMVRPP